MSASTISAAARRPQMLVVFDIDETLIQYVPHKYNALWEERKASFAEGSYMELISGDKKDVIIFRPHLEKMMRLFRDDPFFVPALWTYSEREYCDIIADAIIRRFQLPEDFFLFKYGAEDIDEDVGIPKNLSKIYETFPQFNKFNTILVDDRYGNINNEVNIFNGLCIQPFAPFGAEKVRTQLDDRAFRKELGDKVFDSVIKIVGAIKRDIMGCDEEDFRNAFATEAVFTEKRVKRMKLDAFFKTFAVKFTKVVSIGVPYLTKNFILIPDYHKYSEKMGGASLIDPSSLASLDGASLDGTSLASLASLSDNGLKGGRKKRTIRRSSNKKNKKTRRSV